MENITFSVTKDELQTICGVTFTDEQWSVLKQEMEDTLDYYFYDELSRAVTNIDELVQEYKETSTLLSE